DVVAYQTTALLEKPFAEKIVFLLDVRQGISSFGGFLGAFLAMFYFTRKEGYPLLAATDVLLYALAFGWVFGRLGCFSAHDHPGIYTNFFLGVRYPEGTRHDLGLDEALFAFALSSSFFFLSKKPHRNGFYAAITCIAYGPVRFCFDFLRIRDVGGADPRYF